MPPIVDHNRRDIGGKAATLVELQLAGFRVPDFMCFQQFVTMFNSIRTLENISLENFRNVPILGELRFV